MHRWKCHTRYGQNTKEIEFHEEHYQINRMKLKNKSEPFDAWYSSLNLLSIFNLLAKVMIDRVEIASRTNLLSKLQENPFPPLEIGLEQLFIGSLEG